MPRQVPSAAAAPAVGVATRYGAVSEEAGAGAHSSLRYEAIALTSAPVSESAY
jgi:hypothetical protein